MAVHSSPGRGLTPDVSSEDDADRTASEAKALQTAHVHVPLSHGLGLSPDRSLREVADG
jgi:hypothetical protein